MSNRSYSITIDQLYKCMGKNQALDNLSLSLTSGQIHGLIGPEGAGKTTLIRCLVGLLHPNQGSIIYFENGTPIEFAHIREQIAYMPQQQSLYADLSVDEHLQFFRSMYQISKDDYQQKRAELLEITRLGDFVGRSARNLSGGMYKKLGLMCALLRSPQILLLDEPTNGVDPISRREFWELLYTLHEQNIMIVVTTAYMDEAERCSEVHLMEKGKIIAEGEPITLLKKFGVESIDQIYLKMTVQG